jgi:hypothetical protein
MTDQEMIEKLTEEAACNSDHCGAHREFLWEVVERLKTRTTTLPCGHDCDLGC